MTLSFEQINPAHSICFSAHPPDRLPGRWKPGTQEMQALVTALRHAIETAIQRGMDTFLNDLIAGTSANP